MTGLPVRPKQRSVSFEVRALIFCMRTLYPYVEVCWFSQRPRSKLPFDRFFSEVILTQPKIGLFSMLFGGLWKGP